MIYLWEGPETCPNKDIAVYNYNCSPDRFLLRKGNKLNASVFSQCYAYNRSVLNDLADDFFIRTVVGHNLQTAYIFTRNEMFSFAGGIATKVNTSIKNIEKIKTALSLTDADIDKEPKVLSDEDMNTIDVILGKTLLRRTPLLNINVAADVIEKKYDCIPNNSASPLVNQKVIKTLLKVAPDDVQFFDVEIQCKDRLLTNYKLLNVTHKIIGIDHEKSEYKKMEGTDVMLRIKYLTYKHGCMGKYKLARDGESLGHLLVTEEIKSLFEKEKIKGCRFVTPEVYYGNQYDENGRFRL